MADGNFLPEEDLDYLASKALPHRLLEETLPNGEKRRGIEFSEFQLPPNLYVRRDGELVAGAKVSLMVMIPKGYQETKLDSWYVSPNVYLANGCPADRANGEADLFGRRWQFWSRHLVDHEWRAGIDGLETYLQYIKVGLREA
jgi:hypothetical protein